MLILDTFSDLSEGKIKIPFYHRGHLSLMSGTKATIVYLPGQKRDPSPSISELIISPIDFRSWQYLTRINAKLLNRPGLVRKLLTALAARDIELLYHAIGPLENGKLLRVEFLVDARYFYDEYKTYRSLKSDKENADYHILSELEIWLKGLLIENIDWDGGRARLKVRPMEAFRNAWETFRENRDNDDYQRSERGSATINEGSLTLPEDICKQIPLATSKILFLSDTKDRMLRGILLNPLDSCTYLRVEHDEISSSAKIAEALSSSFIIFTSLSRVKAQRKRSMIEFMLFSPEYPLLFHDSERKKLISSLLAKTALKDLNLQVSYPPNVGAIGPSLLPPNEPEGDILQAPIIPNLVPLEKELMAESTRRILEVKMNLHQQQESDTNDVGVSLNSRKIHTACREILSKLGQKNFDQSIIFVSYPFQFDDLFNELERYLIGLRYKVVTGKGIDSGEAYRKDIISRIKSSHGFIGIWKLDEGAKSIKFSPWLSWELAIAQSCEIPTRIFPHVNLNLNDPAFKPHRRILPEINMIPFSDADFHSYVPDRLKSFRSEVSAFEQKNLLEGPNSYSSTN